MSLQNLQNLHSTNWLCVLDIILFFCFYRLLRGVRELFFVSCLRELSWVGSFQRFLGNSTEGHAKLFPCGVSSPGYQVKFLYFLKWFCLYLILLIWYRIVDLD